MPVPNFISIYGAINIQGYLPPFTQPILEDISPASIVSIWAETTPDVNGNLIPCWRINYVSPKSLEYNFCYIPVNQQFTPTLADFRNNLNALSTTNSFSIYSSWLALNYSPNTLNESVLLNDALTNKRIYNVGTNTTDIYMTVVNDLFYDVYTVNADQTYSGYYYYAGDNS